MKDLKKYDEFYIKSIKDKNVWSLGFAVNIFIRNIIAGKNKITKQDHHFLSQLNSKHTD